MHLCKPIRVEFSVLTKTKEVQVDRHQTLAYARSIDRARRVAERVWQAIDSQHFYPAPLADELRQLSLS